MISLPVEIAKLEDEFFARVRQTMPDFKIAVIEFQNIICDKLTILNQVSKDLKEILEILNKLEIKLNGTVST